MNITRRITYKTKKVELIDYFNFFLKEVKKLKINGVFTNFYNFTYKNIDIKGKKFDLFISITEVKEDIK